MTEEDFAIGFWLSAALEDDKTCKEFKEDIRAWFDQERIKEGLKQRQNEETPDDWAAWENEKEPTL